MSAPSQDREIAVLRRWVARAWKAWQRRRRALAEIGDPEKLDQIARDVGLGRSEVSTLAGKWPDSFDLLSRRLDQVKLQRADLREIEPQVLRDLQRTCGLCARKRTCSHDIASNSPAAKWEDYCPNAVTIRALLAGRRNQLDTLPR